MRRLVIAAAVLLALAGPGRAAACRTIDVSGSIQAAAGSARPCDWVLVPPGVYRESVVLATPGVHLRGLDRNRVVLEGAIEVRADGVTVENMTVRGPDSADAIRWSARGWRGRYLTALAAGALGARGLVADGGDGAWDHVLARGFATAGVACLACRVTASHVLAERNALGVAAAGRLTLQDSLVRLNAFGVQVTGGAIVRRNRVEQNERIGVELAGASGALVANNIVTANRTLGIVAHDGPGPVAAGSRIAGNLVRGSRWDLALDGVSACVDTNLVRTSFPADLSQWTCGLDAPPVPDALDGAELADLLERLGAARRSARAWPAPPPQPSLPDPCRGVPPSALC